MHIRSVLFIEEDGEEVSFLSQQDKDSNMDLGGDGKLSISYARRKSVTSSYGTYGNLQKPKAE